MNEVWQRIFKDYIESYNAIETLKKNEILNEDDYQELKICLLEDIIITFKSEVED